jgi:hypothetical protein
MMRHVFRTCCLLVIIFIGGCVAQRVVWSPDGIHGAVIGDDGLHICDVSGKLSPSLVPDVKCVAWMPDSQRMVVCTQHSFQTWREASQGFPEDAAVASKNADAVRTELLAATKGWPDFVEETQKKLLLSDAQMTLAIMYLRDKLSESLPTRMDKADRESFAAVSIDQDLAQSYTISEGIAVAGPILYRRPRIFDGILSVRVSPTSRAVLLSIDVSTHHEQTDPPQLLLVPTDGSQKICELGAESCYPDWSPDGKYTIYARPVDRSADPKEGPFLGILTRQQVAQDNGVLLDGNHLPQREDLAAVLFDPFLRVRVAGDGRIFFCGVDIQLPAAIKDCDSQPTVFYFDPGKQSTLTRVIPRSALQTIGNEARFFELSPDARYLSIPFDDGRVSVLDIATGEAQLVQPDAEKSQDSNDAKLITVPTWRTATELTFARPVSDSKAHEVVRYSIPENKTTVISTGWPNDMGDWLTGKPPSAATNDSTAPLQK